MSHNRGETLLAIKNIADGPRAHGAHGFPQLRRTRLRPHPYGQHTYRVLPSLRTVPSSPLKTNRTSVEDRSSAASTCKCELVSFARFLLTRSRGSGASVRPGYFCRLESGVVLQCSQAAHCPGGGETEFRKPREDR